MTREERLIHAIACEAALRVEKILAIPRKKRALRFFELVQIVKRGMEEFSMRRDRPERMEPGRN
jgi:hypothetical protein